MFYSENCQSLQKSPQGCGKILSVGLFQIVIGQEAR